MKRLILILVLILILAIILLPAIAFADPFLVSDPNEGVGWITLECLVQPGIDADWSVVFAAEADGSVRWNFADWPHGRGWFDCGVYAGGDYVVIDGVTGEQTNVTAWSDPAPIRIKIPGFKVHDGFRGVR
jgi:hypothetical protein